MNPNFDPSGHAVKNDNFIGLPFSEQEAHTVILPVPWEATVSYRPGTARGPENVLKASYQLDLLDYEFPHAWQAGIYMRPSNSEILTKSDAIRKVACRHIQKLENENAADEQALKEVNEASAWLNDWVYTKIKSLLDKDKKVVLLGGEHSCPYGYIKALAEQHESFGILQIDAHLDLRKAYEGFEHSHASIFYNVLEDMPEVRRLIQVGIRDYCQAELDYAQKQGGRCIVFFDAWIKAQFFRGRNYHELIEEIIGKLPQKVYISFDIDGLQPALCPNTGTPVPGGLDLPHASYLLKALLKSGRQIIGADLCEVGSESEWDGNVGARILYKLCGLLNA